MMIGPVLSRRCGATGLLSRICLILGLLVLPACDATGPGSAPLYSAEIPGGLSYCQAVPAPAAEIDTWHSPVGFALDMYYNQSRLPLTVESVRLLDPHNLVSHGGLVYEMYQDEHPLISAAAWDHMGQGAPARLWAARQAIPGAVIAPGHGLPPGLLPSKRFNMWEVAVDVSAVTPDGGWALGEVVTYRADGTLYTTTAETGIAIGSGDCAPQFKEINAAFERLLKT
jgi:hypothetical protein